MGAKGETNGRAKLSWGHIKLLRKQYQEHKLGKFNRTRPGIHSPFSTAALACEYDVSQSTMWEALTGRSWTLEEAKKRRLISFRSKRSY